MFRRKHNKKQREIIKKNEVEAREILTVYGIFLLKTQENLIGEIENKSSNEDTDSFFNEYFRLVNELQNVLRYSTGDYLFFRPNIIFWEKFNNDGVGDYDINIFAPSKNRITRKE